MSISGRFKGRSQGRNRERDRYDESSRESRHHVDFDVDMSLVEPWVARVYRHYADEVSTVASQTGVVLEVGVGRGDYSWPLFDAPCRAIFLDYSWESLLVFRQRAESEVNSAMIVCADIEALPFRPGTLDAIVGVGVLGYVDHDRFIQESNRALGLSGALILCDSIKGNAFFWLNRWLHVLRGRRSRWVTHNTPSMATYRKFRQGFRYSSLRGFGALGFLYPMARRILGSVRSNTLASLLDEKPWALRQSFKVVMSCRLRNEQGH